MARCYTREAWLPWRGIHNPIYLANMDNQRCLEEALEAALKELARSRLPGQQVHVADTGLVMGDDFFDGLVLHRLGDRLRVTFSVQSPEPVEGRLKASELRLGDGVTVTPVYDEEDDAFVVYALAVRDYPLPGSEEAVRRLARMIASEVYRLRETAREHAGDVVEPVEEKEGAAEAGWGCCYLI